MRELVGQRDGDVKPPRLGGEPKQNTVEAVGSRHEQNGSQTRRNGGVKDDALVTDAHTKRI